MFGIVSLAAALFFSLAAALAFAVKAREESRFGVLLAVLAVLASLAAGIYLLVLILHDDFTISYVAGYSSHDLPLVYKISAFWAGQQGSFLLWLLIHALAGMFLLKKKSLSHAGMAVYLVLQSLLAILVLVKSPFVPNEVAVSDGIGMNPLLQDPWMAVHPPVIFVGYALLAVPFACSLGQLLTADKGKTWLEAMRQWTLVAWAFLGAGIFIGGYWAYKVLGWGGYWGWDPVENSSLVPWLLAAVLLHVLRVARVREGAQWLVHLAAIFSYAFVLYGTFLTRSGILGDFSVHAFGNSNAGLTIAAVNAFVLLAGLLILTWRAKALPQGRLYETYGSREFLILLGMLVTVFTAAVIFLGMSMPLLTQLMGRPAAVDTDFYVRTTMPLAFSMALLLVCACQRHFGGAAPDSGRLPLVSVFAGVAAAWGAGVREALPLLLAGAAALGAAASVRAFVLRGLGLGGMLAHLGLALGLLAMVLAGSGSRQVSVAFAPHEPQEVFGHEITYLGQEFAADGSEKYYKYQVDGREAAALTKLRKNGEDAAREPAIAGSLGGDVYLAPTPTRAVRSELVLEHGQTEMGNLCSYRFDGVAFEDEGGRTIVTAEIAVTDGEAVEHARPFIVVTAEGGTSQPMEVLGGKERLRLTAVSGDRKRVRLEIMPPLAEEMAMPVTASVSVKPVIWLLWLSAILTCAGTLIAVKK